VQTGGQKDRRKDRYDEANSRFSLLSDTPKISSKNQTEFEVARDLRILYSFIL
jgi:hypothetical protein